MNKFKIIISIFLISLLMSCSKSIQVVPLKNTDMQIKKNGMIYFLPQTALEIEFTVTRNVFTAGPYAEYAEKYLSIEGTQTEDKDFYEISNITINPIAIPDPNAVFFICGNSKEKLKLNLTYNNIIKSVNIKSNDIEKAETNNSKSASFSYLNQDIKFLDYT
ncbi:MAG: DUF4831 family protein, partial [Bacteroidales bacterium]|nr:DUF4831 family protein [Bacteroidales bacterium]